jgi:hypothetical protein
VYSLLCASTSGAVCQFPCSVGVCPACAGSGSTDPCGRALIGTDPVHGAGVLLPNGLSVLDVSFATPAYGVALILFERQSGLVDLATEIDVYPINGSLVTAWSGTQQLQNNTMALRNTSSQFPLLGTVLTNRIRITFNNTNNGTALLLQALFIGSPATSASTCYEPVFVNKSAIFFNNVLGDSACAGSYCLLACTTMCASSSSKFPCSALSDADATTQWSPMNGGLWVLVDFGQPMHATQMLILNTDAQVASVTADAGSGTYVPVDRTNLNGTLLQRFNVTCLSQKAKFGAFRLVGTPLNATATTSVRFPTLVDSIGAMTYNHLNRTPGAWNMLPYLAQGSRADLIVIPPGVDATYTPLTTGYVIQPSTGLASNYSVSAPKNYGATAAIYQTQLILVTPGARLSPNDTIDTMYAIDASNIGNLRVMSPISPVVARTDACLMATGTAFYYVGGADVDGNVLSSIELFTVSSNGSAVSNGSLLPNTLSVRRRLPGCTVAPGSNVKHQVLVVAGGIGSNNTLSYLVEMFTEAGGMTLSMPANVTMRVGVFGISVAAVGSKLFFTGGQPGTFMFVAFRAFTDHT